MHVLRLNWHTSLIAFGFQRAALVVLLFYHYHPCPLSSLLIQPNHTKQTHSKPKMQHQQSTPAPRKQLAAAGKKGPAPASSAAASAAAASSPLALNPSSVATSASTRSHNGGGRRPTIQYHKCSATHRGPNGNGNSTNGQMSVKMLEEAERALTSTVVGMLNSE